MNILEEALEIAYRLVVITTVASMTTVALATVFLVWGVLTGPPKKTAISAQPQISGKVSTVSMRTARLALLEKHMTKTSSRPVKKQRRPAKQTKIPSLQFHPVGKPLPRSPISSPVPPKELQPASLQHFFVEGATTFRGIPNLPKSDNAMKQLRQIAGEFMPIIRKRGFHIRSVSEMCCCSNGLEYELGGDRRCVAAGEQIRGNDPDTVAGYNGKLTDRHGRIEHVIHLRLRSPHDHGTFLPLEEIMDTMVHELAHCVYEDHGPQFWAFMDDIAADRAAILERLGQTTRVPDAVAASKEMFEGFNIYASFSSRLRRDGMRGSRY